MNPVKRLIDGVGDRVKGWLGLSRDVVAEAKLCELKDLCATSDEKLAEVQTEMDSTRTVLRNGFKHSITRLISATNSTPAA